MNSVQATNWLAMRKMHDLPADAASSDVVVVDMGGTRIRVGHLQAGTSMDTIETFDSGSLRVDDAVIALACLIQSHVTQYALRPGVVVIGIPGIIDHARDTLEHCNNLPQLEGIGLRRDLARHLGCAVMLEQDIMLQLLGEWRSGSAQHSEAVLGLYFGTGIGAAYLRHGDPFRQGASSLQAGHIPVLGRGKRCMCGNLDCAEAYASGHTLTALAESGDVPVEQLFDRRDHPALHDALDEFILLQAWTIATAVTLLEPDMVLIGGGIPHMAGYPRDELERIVRAHLQHPRPGDTLDIRWAALEAQAVQHGALALIELCTR